MSKSDRRNRSGSSEGQRAPAWMAALFVLAGFAIMGVGGGVIPVDPSSVHAPGWVIVLCGVVFALGGVMAWTNGAGFSEAWSTGLALVFMLCFAAVFSWVAFGPGERGFSGSGSVGPVSVGGGSGETVGRIAFGFGAVLMWVFVAAIFAKLLKSLRSAAD